MPVTFDSTSASSATSVSAVTWSHVNGGDYLAVSPAYYVGLSTIIRSTTITFAGSPLTLISSRVYVEPAGLEVHQDLWVLKNPSTGTSTITITFTAAADIVAGAVSYAGVSTHSGYVASTGQSSIASATVVSASGDLVIDALCVPGSTVVSTVGAGQTLRYSRAHDGFAFNRHAASDEAGGASIIMSWGFASTRWGLIGLNLVSSAAGAPASLHLTLLGVQ